MTTWRGSPVLSWPLVVGLCVFLVSSPSWVTRVLVGVRPGVEVAGIPVGGLMPGEVSRLVAELAPAEQIEPINASIDRETGRVMVEVPGRELDVWRTVAITLAAARRTHVDLVMVQVDPPVLACDLYRAVVEIGFYITGVGGSENRAHNVALATSLMNHTVVEPGGMFSFNQVVGPRTYGRGFKAAPVLVGGGSALDAGGGVCQVSSTLYNAVLAAGLDVAERHPHSKPVRYVPPGRDATVVYDYLDLKFINTRPAPIVVRGSMSGRSLRIWILGVEEQDKGERN